MSVSHETSTVSTCAAKLAIKLFACICSVSLLAQSSKPDTSSLKPKRATVTFVDNKMSLTGGLPGQKSEAFRGKLFIENQLLATMVPGHFVTFELDPVTVDFTAQTWMATGPTGGAHITLSLVAGKHYFIEVRTKQAWPVTKMFGIKEITCEEAEQEHEHDEPLDSSHVKANGDPPAVAETAFPACSKH